MTTPVAFTKDDDLDPDLHKPVWSCRIYIVVTLFSISATLGMDALWVATPISSSHLPEGSKATNYLVCFFIFGNLAALAYLITYKCARPGSCNEAIPIYGCLALALACSVLLALFWDDHRIFRQQNYSLMYLGAALGLAQVACLGTVTYVPFVARLKPAYITAVPMGEAIAGLIPHLIALGQGIGEPPNCRPNLPANRTWISTGWRRVQPTTTLAPIIPPPLRFNESIYFFVMTGVLCLSAFCFLVLRCIPSVRFEYDQILVDCMDDIELAHGSRSHAIEEVNEGALICNAGYSLTPTIVLDDGSVKHASLRNMKNSFALSPCQKHHKGPKRKKSPHNANFVPPCRLAQQQQSSSTGQGTGLRQRIGFPKSRSKTPLSPYYPPSACLMLTFTLWACIVINGPLSSVKAHSCLPLGSRLFQSGTLMTKVGSIIAVMVTLKVNQYSRVTMTVAFTSLGTIVLTYFVALISFSHESESREVSPIFMNTGELLSVSKIFEFFCVFCVFYFLLCANTFSCTQRLFQ